MVEGVSNVSFQKQVYHKHKDPKFSSGNTNGHIASITNLNITRIPVATFSWAVTVLIGKTQAIEHPKASVVSDSEEIAQRLAGPKVKGTVMALNTYKWY